MKYWESFVVSGIVCWILSVIVVSLTVLVSQITGHWPSAIVGWTGCLGDWLLVFWLAFPFMVFVPVAYLVDRTWRRS